MTDPVPVVQAPVPSVDQERWQQGIQLVGEWLAGYAGNTRVTYADAIGFPLRPGTWEWRGYATLRQGVTWLAWCHLNCVHLFDASRLQVLAWLDVVHASRDPINGEPLSKRAKAQMVSAASSFYTWAIEEGHTERSPIAFNRARQGLNTGKDNSPTRSLSRAEVKQLLQAADADPVQSSRLRTAAIIWLLFEVGPRVTEGICKPTLADMYVQDGRRVLHTVLKGNKDHLYPLPPGVCDRIDAYLASRRGLNRLPALRSQAGTSTTPLFATSTGKPITRFNVLLLVKRIAELARLDEPHKVHPHVGRHSWATEARRQGNASGEIQKHFGHAYESTSARYGTHILDLERSPVHGVAAAFESEE